MEARKRLGAVLIIAGLGVAVAGVVGAIGGFGAPSTATASPTPASTSASTPVATEPGMSLPAPTAQPTVDTLAIVRAFFVELEAAVHAGAQETLADSLGEAVIDRYGLDACTANLAIKEPFPEQAFEILAVLPPAPWDYVTDELTTTVPDATTVQARVTGPDASGAITTEDRELHVQVVDGAVFWFTDCGTPLGG